MLSTMFSKGRLLGIALGALIMLGGAAGAQADGWSRRCEDRIAHERIELDRAVARHGYYSHQADHERRELDRLYAECGNRDHYR